MASLFWQSVARGGCGSRGARASCSPAGRGAPPDAPECRRARCAADCADYGKCAGGGWRVCQEHARCENDYCWRPLHGGGE